MRSLQIKHVAALDSLRAIAALLVFAQHFSQQFQPFNDLKGVERMLETLSQFGVAAFFVLSGFLIHSGGLVEQSKSGAISWRNYFWRRSSRILPGYYVSLLVSAAFVQFWQSELMLHTGWFGIIAHVFLISSFISGESVTISGVFWTVVVECHFYAIYILMWKTTTGTNLARVGIIFMVGSVLVFLLVSVLVPSGPLRTLLQFTAPSLLWKWCLGIFIAEASYSSRFACLRGFFSREWLIIPSIALIVGGSLLINPSMAVNYNRFVLPIGCFSLVCLCVFSRLGERRNKFLEWAGDISYSIYLWHPLALLITLHLTQVTGIYALAMTLLLMFAFAWFGYVFIEKPGMAFGKRRVTSAVQQITQATSQARQLPT